MSDIPFIHILDTRFDECNIDAVVYTMQPSIPVMQHSDNPGVLKAGQSSKVIEYSPQHKGRTRTPVTQR